MSNNNDFADVTLACEDGQQGEAHKVILAGQMGRSSLINYLTVIVISTSAVGKRMQVSRAQLPRFPPTQVPVGIDGLASLAKDIYGCSIDRASLFPIRLLSCWS